jgi:serine/threonine protein kinase
MNDATASDAPDGNGAPLGTTELTAPLPDAGTLDHVPAPASGTVDHVSVDNDGTEVIGGGTVDHVPASGDGTDNIDDAVGGHTVDPESGKWIGGPDVSKTAPPVRKKEAPPKTVAGYEILGVLGRGAMGVVYKARQRGLNRLVALKMILSGTHASEHELGRFRTEAEAVARIQHANIVQIYEVGEEEGRPFFSLEYVDGGSLERKIKGKPQSPVDAARLVHALATGMDCAHRANVIHRDLKPANILLAADGTPKITDFGLAKRLEDESGQTHSGSILGTPSYMSPEQAEGRNEEIGPLADVWSLGAILYELLTGRVPFQAPTILETIWQVRMREPVAPTELQPKVPRDLETICLKCLQKDRNKRYASSGALAEDLRRFLNNEPILARPVSQWERTWRWCKRNPSLAITGAIALALLIIWGSTMSVGVVVVNRQKNVIQEAQKQADKNARDALEQKAVAEKNEKRANKEADLAKRQFTNALKRLTEFGEEMQRQLNARRFMEMGSQMRVLRDDMLTMLRRHVLEMGRDLEQSSASSFGTLGGFQNMGDLLRRLGQGEEALKQYRLAHELAEKLVKEQPDSDLARANLAIILMALGDMELELYGEARKARDTYETGRKMRQEVADHPHSDVYTDLDNKINLSHYEMRLCKAEMALGNPEAALGHCKKCIDLRKAWLEAQSKDDQAQNYLAQGYQWLAIARWHTGDAAGSREAFTEAARFIDGLLQKYKNAHHYKADLADIIGTRGDAEISWGMPEQAEKSYQESLKYLQPALARVPNYAEYQLALALHHERMAVVAQRKGNLASAKVDYEEALRIRKELLGIEPNNMIWLGSALRVKAHTGDVSLAVKQLEMLYRRRPRSIPLLLDAARACATGVALSTEPAVKQRYVERAVGALHTAVRAGYKDSIALNTDPDLAPLRQEPLFTSLLAGLPRH